VSNASWSSGIPESCSASPPPRRAQLGAVTLFPPAVDIAVDLLYALVMKLGRREENTNTPRPGREKNIERQGQGKDKVTRTADGEGVRGDRGRPCGGAERSGADGGRG